MDTHSTHPAAPDPAAPGRPFFVVGQNRRGQWLVVDGCGAGGGIFASREAAMRYAAAQTNRRPRAVRLAGSPIELRF